MIFSGNQFATCSSALPSIEPQFVRDGVALLAIRGGVDGWTTTGLEAACRNIRRAADVRSVVVTIDSEAALCWPADVLEPLDRLSRCKPLFAYIEVAIGASYLAALPACCVVAHPQVAVGRFGGQVPGECDANVARRLDAANDEIVATVRRYRPQIEPRIARRLLTEEITSGEVLEHFGAVDCIMPLARLLKTLGAPNER